MIENSLKKFIALVVIVGLVFLTYILNAGQNNKQNILTLYCSHDKSLAEDLIKQFQDETGINVNVVYDTEATKSLGLTQQIIAEKESPICDVFWNNQMLGTEQLKNKNTLQPYKSRHFENIPPQFKDPDGYYTGFAARMRVYIINKGLMRSTQIAIDELLASHDYSKIAIANPRYGTTLTDFAARHQYLGDTEFNKWWQEAKSKNIICEGGNSKTMNLVSKGICKLGYTDTDDYFVAIDNNKPVAMLPIKVGGKPIVIPNTVAIIKDCRHPKQAKQFVDFVLSQESQLMLAKSKSRQIPLGKINTQTLPTEIKQLIAWTQNAIDLRTLTQSRVTLLKQKIK